MPDRRTRPAANPIATLLFIAAFPAVVLFGVWRYALSQDDSAPPEPDRIAEFPATTPRTPVLSARRTPEVLARETSSTAFEGALRPLGGAVLPGSCAAVSVDGALALSDGIDTSVTPASTLKVAVAAVALDVLGPDFVYTTSVHAEIVNGSVGSIYLVGGGDPLLASSWYPDDGSYNRYPQQPATSFDALADAVVQAGVTQVAGNVVGDASRYDAELYPSEWPITFRAVEGGPISALLANDGITRGQPGRAADPAQSAAQEFTRLLQARGVVIAGQPTSGVMPAGLPAVASVSSAPLSQVIGEMLRNSDNNTAEMMVKEIGRAAKGAGSRGAGTATIRERLESWGVPMSGVAIVDGSGLARENKMTCAAMMALLDRFRIDSPLVAAMAVAGRTGTLADDFIGDPLEARLIGKTGSLTGVKALVGYVPVDGVGTIRFAVMLEGNGVDQEGTFRPIWETYLSDALSSYPSGPTADRLVPLEPVATP